MLTACGGDGQHHQCCCAAGVPSPDSIEAVSRAGARMAKRLEAGRQCMLHTVVPVRALDSKPLCFETCPLTS